MEYRMVATEVSNFISIYNRRSVCVSVVPSQNSQDRTKGPLKGRRAPVPAEAEGWHPSMCKQWANLHTSIVH